MSSASGCSPCISITAFKACFKRSGSTPRSSRRAGRGRDRSCRGSSSSATRPSPLRSFSDTENITDNERRDFRSREANVYRLAEVSAAIIDQCVAQGVPFAREYGGLLANRSFGGAQVSRTFYARGQTGQQLLLGAYQALMRQVALEQVELFPRTEMLELVVVNGHAKGIVVRDMITGKISSHSADAVVLATGGYCT